MTVAVCSMSLAATRGRPLVRPPPILGWQWCDHPQPLQASDGAVQRAWAQALAAERTVDVVDHGVAVLGAIGKADQDQQRWLRKGESPRGTGNVASRDRGLLRSAIRRTA